MYLDFGDLHIPLKIKRDWKNTVRYSISRKSVNLTLPKFYTKSQIIEECHKIKAWTKIQMQKSPSIADRFRLKIYNHGDTIIIYGHKFSLNIYSSAQKGLSAEINDQKVEIFVPDDLSDYDRNSSISILLSRLFSKHFINDIKERVHDWNDQYFYEDIHDVRLKNNQSNWGSCSTNRIVNLSSRLLFAPSEIIDYVIVHELSHFKEMNHSPKFWKVVKDVMPDYKSKDKWLSTHGHLLRY